MKTRRWFVAAVAIATVALGAPAHAADGDQDPSFGGGDGEVAVGGIVQRQRRMALQPDGKIVAVGSANGRFLVHRYTASGALDSSFDTDGQSSPLAATGDAYDVLIQPDGKIVVVGESSGGSACSGSMRTARPILASAAATGSPGTSGRGTQRRVARHPDSRRRRIARRRLQGREVRRERLSGLDLRYTASATPTWCSAPRPTSTTSPCRARRSSPSA